MERKRRYQTLVYSIVEPDRSAATLNRAKVWLLDAVRAKRTKQWLLGSALLFFFLLLAGVFELSRQYAHYAALIDARLADHSLLQTPGIYAAPRRVSIGQQLTSAELQEHLLNSGFLATATPNEFAIGNFQWSESSVVIRTNAFAQNTDCPERTRVEFSANRVRAIQDETTGAQRAFIMLPPALLTGDFQASQQRRRALSFEEIPAQLVHALCAAEDRRFFEHQGVDWRGVLRAALSNFRHNEIRQGGSTLTQQLVKNEFLTPTRTWERKVAEAMLAIALERRLSKQQILALYCERVYLGRRGLTSIYGFRQAAAEYFGKELPQLSLAEAAFLAALVKAPNRYANAPQEALTRRNLVLAAMVATGAVSAAEANASQTETLAMQPPPSSTSAAAPWFIDHVNCELADQQLTGRLYVQTTLDQDLQQAAQQTVTAQLQHIRQLLARQKTTAQPEAALVALDPQTGEILALIGGSDYAASQFNRATEARRQPGSVFKPIVYAAALRRGVSPAETFKNEPHDINFGYQAVYRPQNFHRSYSYQAVTLREALVRSLNVVTVDAAMETGLSNVALLAEQLGLPRPAAYPSMALGAFEATPLEIARAYTTFANGGVQVKPFAIKSVTSHNAVIYENENNRTTLLPATTAYLITDALADVVNRGTATRIRQLGYRGPAAGKTGTSRDAWFVGYTPKLLVAVWVGFDDNRDLQLTGGEAAAPIWAMFVKRALELRPDLAAKTFAKPAGLETVEIDPTTGGVANPYCPQRQRMLLSSSLTPEVCTLHQPPPEILDDLLAPLELSTVQATPTSVSFPPPEPRQ